MLDVLKNNIVPRFELKFVIPKIMGIEIINNCSFFMELDKNVNQFGYYSIKSLYFDTLDYKDYYDVINGERTRKKLRLRRYNDNYKDVSFEVKHKDNKIISKDRIKTNIDTALLLIKKPFEFEKSKLNNIAFNFAKDYIISTITTSYNRIPLVGMFSKGVRVTLDFDFRAGKEDLFFRKTNISDVRVIPSDIAILEVKIDKIMPLWVKNILQKHELSAETYSKYTNSVDRVLGDRVAIDELID